jgi:hypothetical protein
MTLHTPNLAAPLVAGDRITPAWAKYLREIHAQVTAELSPGRIAPFYLDAADLADADQFVQAGTTAGLGVGIRLGWALCNGNNGTPALDGKYLAWSTAAAGTEYGSDTLDLAALVHSSIGAATLYTQAIAVPLWIANTQVALASATSTAGRGFGVTVVDVATGSATPDNRPATKTLVPLMRVQ